MKNKLLLTICLLFLSSQVFAETTTVTYTTAGTYYWVCPIGVTSLVSVSLWGGGGGGGYINGGGGGGGGGGAYANTPNVPVTPGTVYTVVVGVGGTRDGGIATKSTFATTTVVADCGLSSSNATGALGGIVANCTGTNKFKGGDGKNAVGTNDTGGGGGGAGGPAGAGEDGVIATTSAGGNGGRGDAGSGGALGAGSTGAGVNGSPGGASALGGGGGGGSYDSTTGGAGGIPGGGGGGTDTTTAGTAGGAVGRAEISYTTPTSGNFFLLF